MQRIQFEFNYENVSVIESLDENFDGYLPQVGDKIQFEDRMYKVAEVVHYPTFLYDSSKTLTFSVCVYICEVIEE